MEKNNSSDKEVNNGGSVEADSTRSVKVKFAKS